ncbi:polysaccharide export outer membrane protein [Loktanella fryxellensis]|uniref:Polysaccharide export outer membrane protein n=1 Tax=Loktanella fryxellensis TaxID=245187 RepID=A0A1H8H4Q3_9RHOB|nr:polysaccharide biosynthesis/export family protein [Loktanella fryxellensis]SEN51233.1 polysaccharide export outer membrane protein [Loktanella fryxellensis]
MTRFHLVPAVALTLALSGCGSLYVSSTVQDQTEGLNVRIIPVTPETVLQANTQAYTPRDLPGVFFTGAGTGSPRGAGGLPDAPSFPDLTPGRLDLRAPPAAERGPYLLGPGDVLGLSLASTQAIDPVTGSTDGQTAMQDLVVRDDGAVSIPQVGAVQVGGLPIDEAEAQIFARLVDAGIDPNFGVQVTGFNSQRFSVGGAVAAEQVLTLGLNRTSLAQALAQAGGIAVTNPEFASIRIYRDGTLYQIPLAQFRADAAFQNLAVLPGDAVYVDTTYDLDRAQAFYRNQIDIISLRREDRSAALSELSTEVGLRRADLSEQREIFVQRDTLGATDRDYVYLAGEVTNPGRFPLPYGQQATLADVLYDGGGFNAATGNPSQIYVLRPDPAVLGAVTAWHLNARNAVVLTLATRFEMRPDDIIFIEEQPITSFNRVLQQSIPSLITTTAAAVN